MKRSLFGSLCTLSMLRNVCTRLVFRLGKVSLGNRLKRKESTLSAAIRRAIAAVVVTLSALGMSAPSASQHGDHDSGETSLAPVTAAFDSHGVLWRLSTDSHSLTIDRSTDFGKTFRGVVSVLKRREAISASAEVRPQIAINDRGRIFVSYERKLPALYAADVMLAVSEDAAATFSAPAIINDNRESIGHSFHTLAVAPDGRAYVLWLDDRGGNAFHDNGRPNARGLYYVVTDGTVHTQANMLIRANGVCDCCRLAIAFEQGGAAVVAARMATGDGIRDHGLAKLSPDGLLAPLTRVTFDDWKIDACPHHGPALSIDDGGRYHLVWFSGSDKRQGLFYARSDDGGRTFTQAQPVGRVHTLSDGHPDIMTAGDRVFVVWLERHDGRTIARIQRSADRGVTWSSPADLITTTGAADYPRLLHFGARIFVSWQTARDGYHVQELVP